MSQVEACVEECNKPEHLCSHLQQSIECAEITQFIICLNPDASLIVSSPWTEFLSLGFIFTKHFSGMGSSDLLSRNCFSQIHSGPSRQSAFTDSSSSAEPLVGMSARTMSPIIRVYLASDFSDSVLHNWMKYVVQNEVSDVYIDHCTENSFRM